VTERELRDSAALARRVKGKAKRGPLPFPVLASKPPRALPRSLLAPRTRKGKQGSVAGSVADAAQALVIQIVPHDNGEVFLSTVAVRQNPRFFGFPFKGKTKPKKKANVPYTQRKPDPRVDLEVYDSAGKLATVLRHYGLNTVHYKRKGEIRITVRPKVVQKTPAYSVLLMERANQPGLEYRMRIYAPGSARYEDLLAVCDQKMPGGGKRRRRRFGWL
jgi:hypothetical protein